MPTLATSLVMNWPGDDHDVDDDDEDEDDDGDDDDKLACEDRFHDHLRARCLKMEKCQQRGKGMIRKSRHR